MDFPKKCTAGLFKRSRNNQSFLLMRSVLLFLFFNDCDKMSKLVVLFCKTALDVLAKHFSAKFLYNL